MTQAYITKIKKLDFEFFYFIHKRYPTDTEFDLFRENLDNRDGRYILRFLFKHEVNEYNFSSFYTATKRRRNPFEATQREYDGWSEDDI